MKQTTKLTPHVRHLDRRLIQLGILYWYYEGENLYDSLHYGVIYGM